MKIYSMRLVTITVIIPVSLSILGTRKILSGSSDIWFRVVHSAWLDFWNWLVCRLCIWICFSMTTDVPVLLNRADG